MFLKPITSLSTSSILSLPSGVSLVTHHFPFLSTAVPRTSRARKVGIRSGEKVVRGRYHRLQFFHQLQYLAGKPHKRHRLSLLQLIETDRRQAGDTEFRERE